MAQAGQLEITRTVLVLQDPDLFGDGMEQDFLSGRAGGQSCGKRTVVAVSPPAHLMDQHIMSQEKGFKFAFPPQDLWMVAVARLPLGQD